MYIIADKEFEYIEQLRDYSYKVLREIFVVAPLEVQEKRKNWYTQSQVIPSPHKEFFMELAKYHPEVFVEQTKGHERDVILDAGIRWNSPLPHRQVPVLTIK